jgi:thiamine pyrophosphokinase
MIALIIGPLIKTSRSFERTLFAAGLDPHRLQGVIKVGVDGGLHVIRKMGVKPHFAVGDWDSMPSGELQTALEGVLHLSLPEKKDRSDLFYACRAAAAAGATDLICVGVTGGRPDHHLGMMYDLSEVEATEPGIQSVAAIDEKQRYFFVSGGRKWEGRVEAGQLVSVFSLGSTAHGVTLDGFEYPLKNADLKPSSHGLSNLAKRPHCRVSVKKGRLVVMALLP